ncbi:MAG: tRNA guanosine(34) transglycosylase Tgt [Patescibacteria group bacterium]
MPAIKFTIEKRGPALARAGVIDTPHGPILTPAFAVVGTKATVKAITTAELSDIGAQILLCNTYHLHLRPSSELIKKAGGLHKFVNWVGPIMTDSGGFQVFSLGAAMGKGISKITSHDEEFREEPIDKDLAPVAKISDDGVSFKSYIDGAEHYFTPERSIEIQHNLGADIIFAFDECTSPHAGKEYQKEALERTHKWAARCIEYHKSKPNADTQALFGIVQGGKYEDLRIESAKEISSLGFDGYAIGGSFSKEDIGSAVRLVNENLPEDKPRHLLGIGEPRDIFDGVENGCDTFDCVAPTRNARNGALYTKDGRINIYNTKYREDLEPLEKDCGCYTCQNFTKAYLSHLFYSKEILANTLASIHNVYFIVQMVKDIRASILEDRFPQFKKEFVDRYYPS